MVRWKGLGLVAALGLLGSGCSFAFVDAAPEHPKPGEYFDCTSTVGLPVADGVFALSNALGAATALRKSKEEYADLNDGANRDVVVGISAASAAVFVASGIYGIVRTEQCRDAKRKLQRELARRPPLDGASDRSGAPGVDRARRRLAPQAPAMPPASGARAPATEAQPVPAPAATEQSAPTPEVQPAPAPDGAEVPRAPSGS